MRSPGKCAGLNRVIIFLISLVFLPLKTVCSAEQAVLKLILNEQDKGEFFFVLAPEGDIWMARGDFEQLGLKEGLGRDVQFGGTTHVSMQSVPGLAFRINQETVALEVHAVPSLFRQHDVDTAYRKPYDVILTGDRSAFLNYSVDYDYADDEDAVNVFGELGMSAGSILGTSTFTYQKTQETDKGVRLMTSIGYSDRDTLKTVTVGDFSSSSGVLGSMMLLGGISYSRNFSLDPFFLRQPPLKLSGSVETPSDVEIYLDGTPVAKEKLTPGAFTFENIPATLGFGTASMVITDVFGRERIITAPYYYSDQILQKGLHEYSYNAGFLREDFGVKDFSYGKPALMGVHHFGFSNRLTLGYAAEASSSLLNIGPSVSFLAFGRGIVNAAFAGSRNSGQSGLSGMIGYTYQSKNFNAGLFIRSDSREYSNLAVKPSDDKAKLLCTGTIGFGAKKTGYIGAEYSYAEMYEAARFSRIALTYTRTLTERASLFVTARETRDIETHDEMFFGVHISLDRRISGSAHYSKKDGEESRSVTIQRSLPPGNGFGFRADMISTDHRDYVNGSVSYQNSYGSYRVDMTGNQRDMDYRVSAAGGIGYIDRSVFLSRPITDSFVKVKVGRLEDVRVYYYGNEVGRTDRNGELVVTSIRSYQDNRIGIESQDIPIDYSITSLTRYISPPSRNGSVVDFDVTRIQAITGNIHTVKDGARTPLEYTRLSFKAGDTVTEGLVGRNGEFYLENIPPGRYAARTVYAGEDYRCDIIIPESADMFLSLGDIECDAQR